MEALEIISYYIIIQHISPVSHFYIALSLGCSGLQSCTRQYTVVWWVPGGEGEKLIVGYVQDAQILVANQQSATVLI